MPERIIVVGLPGNDIPAADVYAGGKRLLGDRHPAIVIGGDISAALDAIGRAPGTVCVLASGDPGFFGIGRALAARFGSDRLDIRPAP